MRTIYKYDISQSNGPHEIRGEILHVAMQGRNVCVWAIHDDDNRLQRKVFHVVGTGMALPKYFGVEHHAAIYIGTVQSGPFVWHVFAEDVLP